MRDYNSELTQLINFLVISIGGQLQSFLKCFAFREETAETEEGAAPQGGPTDSLVLAGAPH